MTSSRARAAGTSSAAAAARTSCGAARGTIASRAAAGRTCCAGAPARIAATAARAATRPPRTTARSDRGSEARRPRGLSGGDAGQALLEASDHRGVAVRPLEVLDHVGEEQPGVLTGAERGVGLGGGEVDERVGGLEGSLPLGGSGGRGRV